MDWDLNALMERLEGDREFLRELLTIFQQDVRTNLEKSHVALADDQLTELSRAAHTLKGMLKNLSMGEAAQTAAALEQAAREGALEPSRELLEQLTRQLEEIQPEVAAQLVEVKR